MNSEIIKWGFYLYLWLVPLMPQQINDRYRILDIYFVALILIYIVNMIRTGEGRKKLFDDLKSFFKDFIIIFMIVTLGVMVISMFYSTDRGKAINEAIRFGTYLAMIYYIVSEVNLKKEYHAIINAVYYPAFIVGILGIIQFITKIGIEVNTNGALRIESTMGHPNSLGVYFVFLLFPLIPLIFSEKSKGKKYFYIVLALIMVTNIGLCLSRNAWVALGIGIVLLAIVYNWRILIGLLVGGGAVLLIPALNSRLMDMGSKIFSDGRIKHWSVALEMFKDKPLTGVGNGNYEVLHSKYLEKFPQFIVPGEENFPTHNSYLKVLSELGILGFIPFILLQSTIVIRTINVCRKCKKEYSGVIKGLTISIIVFLQVNLLDNMWFVPKVTTIYWVFIAIVILLGRKRK